ncbi:MAG: Ltp family lipoprotein [Lachnospiraceae bacterium]|nr:Ltp family lipoprotein [Lachnospiraceae bacterium]
MKKKLLVIMVCLSFWLNACGNKDTVQGTNNDPENEVEVINGDEMDEEVTLIEHTPEELKEELGDASVLPVEPINISDVNVGDIIEFGNYEQDNNKSNGSEAIEWYVIDIENDHAILMSVYALDCKSYNDTDESVTWETCSLRTWLNDDFYNEAFNADEKCIVRLTALDNNSNPDSGISGGNSTQDRVFILSYDEAVYYFNADINASKSNPYDYHIACAPTAYAEQQGAKKYENGRFFVASNNTTCMYWFRTVGGSQNRAVDMYIGFISVVGSEVNYGNHGIRPCVTVNLNGVISSDVETEKVLTVGEINALNLAHAYLEAMPFSLNGLIEQLEYEGFSYDEAKYAADNCGADWKEQAVLMGRKYLELYGFSRSDLYEQLKYEGFSSNEAGYALRELGL